MLDMIAVKAFRFFDSSRLPHSQKRTVVARLRILVSTRRNSITNVAATELYLSRVLGWLHHHVVVCCCCCWSKGMVPYLSPYHTGHGGCQCLITVRRATKEQIM